MIDSDIAIVAFAYIALIVGLVGLACAGACIVAWFSQMLEDSDEEYL